MVPWLGQMAPCLNVVLVVLLLWPGAQSTTPLTEKSAALRKVSQLLQELSTQLVDDAKADAKQFTDFQNLTLANIAAANATVQKTTTEVAELKASIASAEAFQAEKKSELAGAADSLLKAQQDLQMAKQQRLSEKEMFVKSSQKLQQSAENLNLALATVKSLFGGSLLQDKLPQTEGIVQATKQIRTALNAGADKLLTSNQQRFLARLLTASRTPKVSQAHLGFGFLQVNQKQHGSSDEDELSDPDSDAGVGDLKATLKQVKEQTEAEMTATHQAELKSAAAFIALTKSLEDEVTARQTALTELKSAISSSEEAAGKGKGDLIYATRRLTVTNQQLVQLQVDLKDKTKDYEMRKQSRKSEEDVIKEAVRILTKSDATATSFIQLEQSSQSKVVSSFSRRKVAKLMSTATSPGLAALLLQSQTSGRKDVFQKVKAMIHEMLSKLREQQTQDSRRDAWCKTELANTQTSKASKSTRADKLKTRMLAMNAELASLKSEIATGREEITNMRETLSAATLQRNKEQEKARSDVIMYEEDQRVLKEALVVLKRVYGESPVVKSDKHGYTAKSQGSSVVSLLQVSLENFAELEEETSASEKQAAADFKEMESTTQVRLATFEKDVEYNSQTFTKLESDLVRASSDLGSYEKEVKALTKYLQELDVSCSVKGLSFEERQEKRQQQLESLKEALRSLKKE